MLPLETLDFLELEASLGEEERLLQATAREFIQRRVLPQIEEHYQQATFPQEWLREMGKLGFFGANLKGYGCPGLSHLGYGLLNQELEAGDSGVRSVVSVQTSLVMYAIHTFGSEAQKQSWLPRLASGEALGCFALTEPDFGSNPGAMHSKAERLGTGFRLNGAKAWITNGSIADVAVVWAKLEGKVQGFLVTRDLPGFEAREIKAKHSFRASITAELRFQDCELSAEARLPLAEGLKAPLACLNQARFGVAWGALGAARTCFAEAKSYTKARRQFRDQPLAAHQLIQAKLAEMFLALQQAQALTWQVTHLKQQEKALPAHISLIKLNNTEMALKLARTAREMLGANGISSAYPIMRHLCNLESVVTYEGTSDIHRLTLGKEITGIDAFQPSL